MLMLKMVIEIKKKTKCIAIIYYKRKVSLFLAGMTQEKQKGLLLFKPLKQNKLQKVRKLQEV